jgi:hypothetical protein
MVPVGMGEKMAAMVEPFVSAHAKLGFEEVEVIVLQWFDDVGLALGYAEPGRLIAWFDDDDLPSTVAQIAVDVHFYGLSQGWSQLRCCFRHGGGESVVLLINDLLHTLLEVLRADSRWSIDHCHGLPESLG